MALDQLQTTPPAKAAPAPASTGSTEPINPDRWLDEHGNALFGFARLRVRDASAAQDLVQETFLAALRARASFAGRSTERAWLFGILRNKLADYYRRLSREQPWPEPDSASPEEEGFFHAAGIGKDGWVHRLAPQRWHAPDESLVSKEFQAIFEQCLAGLPERVAQVFLRRQLDEVPSEDVCKEFGLSPNNLWVILHRARLGLRRCLEVHWFGRKPGKD